MSPPESKHSVRVAAVQHACGPDARTNLERSLEGVQRAVAQGAELVVLQELHRGPYPCQEEHPRWFDWAEPLEGPTHEALAAEAKAGNCVIVGSIFERRTAGLYHNTAIVLDRNGERAGYYRKMHIPDDPGYFEKFYFTPGDTGFAPIDTAVGRLGVLVCWDQWFPEAARIAALEGAELLLYPSAIGWDPGDPPEEQDRQRDAWITIQRAHAIANGLPVVAVNRVGTEEAGGFTSRFWGGSFIAGPQGELLARAGEEPEVLHASLEIARTETVRRMWPFLRDRRIDAYAGLLERFGPTPSPYRRKD